MSLQDYWEVGVICWFGIVAVFGFGSFVPSVKHDECKVVIAIVCTKERIRD